MISKAVWWYLDAFGLLGSHHGLWKCTSRTQSLYDLLWLCSYETKFIIEVQTTTQTDEVLMGTQFTSPFVSLGHQLCDEFVLFSYNH